jgi:hypothetical protein
VTAKGGILTVTDRAALERIFQPGLRFGEIRFPAASPAAPLAGAINAAYLACGCEMARWFALAGLVAGAALAFIVLPAIGALADWRWGLTIGAGVAGFAVCGTLGEHVGKARARAQLRRLVDQARACLAAGG